jgi:hypothetical protein
VFGQLVELDQVAYELNEEDSNKNSKCNPTQTSAKD